MDRKLSRQLAANNRYWCFALIKELLLPSIKEDREEDTEQATEQAPEQAPEQARMSTGAKGHTQLVVKERKRESNMGAFFLLLLLTAVVLMMIFWPKEPEQCADATNMSVPMHLQEFEDIEKHKSERQPKQKKRFYPSLSSLFFGMNTKEENADLAELLGLSPRDFDVVPNMGGGDCLFYCYLQALEERRTPQQLREIVAESLTPQTFLFLSDIYQGAQSSNDKQLQADYDFMRGVGSLEELKQVVLTRVYFGDEMALEALDKYFGVCTLVFRREKNGGLAIARRYKSEEVCTRFLFVLLDASTVHYELIEVTSRGKKRRIHEKEDLPPKIMAYINAL